jgi:hypothetical protein
MDNLSEDQIQKEEQERGEGLGAALAVNAALAFLAGGAHVAEPLAWRVGGLRAAVERLNRKAEKLGLEGIRLAELGTVTVREPGCRPLVRTTVAVYGQAPRAAGFSLIARIEHTAAGCLVARSPVGAEGIDLSAYFDSRPVCAHCGFDRKRKDTFVVRNDETGEMQQIGRNCLADFIRSEDAAAALQMWKFLYEVDRAAGDGDDDWGSSGGWSRHDDSVLTFVACAVSSIRREGFKKSEAGPGSTKMDSCFLAGPRPEGYGSRRQEWDEGQPTEADGRRAALVIAFCQASEEQSDYMRNLRVAASLPYVERHHGLLASAPVAYQRTIEREFAAKREKNEPKAPPRGGHVGEVGKRSDFGSLTVVRVRFVDNDWGGKTILTLETADGSQVTWFASGSRDFDAGTVLEGSRGTVKKHEEYRGQPQTVVSRLTWKALVLSTGIVEKAS